MTFYYPKISIITPSYNQGKYLEKTILSILNQNYPNLEYIIIDGYSSDNSIEIIKKYSSSLAYWISEKDSGQSEAINKGFKKCNGEIVAYLNSDDVYTENTLFTVADYFNKHPNVDLLYGNAEIIDGKDNFISHIKEIPFDEKMGMYIGYGLIIPQQTTFWKKNLFDIVGYFDENLHYSMDSDFWRRVTYMHKKIVHINKLLAKQRYHLDSKTISNYLSINLKAIEEKSLELKKQYSTLKISKYLPYRFSWIIRNTYRLKRIAIRFFKGHYFSGYNLFFKY